ncbi:MAG: VanZ family protein [Nostocaceae cyanobacterium]|nr:VanZ family protein [Nostocaceae cyanobacterium]
MNPHPNSTESRKNDTNNDTNILARCAFVIIICSTVIVLFSTLTPFNFSFPEKLSFPEIISSFYHQSDFNDVIANIFLFLPFGFGITYLMEARKLPYLSTLIIILTASASLSFSVEFLQLFLPSRSSSFIDIFTNTTGGFLGFISFQLFKSRLFRDFQRYVSLKNVTGLFLGYLTLVILILLSLSNQTNLSSWDSSFSLMLGNEATGGRPWQGYISELAIANKAISESEIRRTFAQKSLLNALNNSLVAAYQFTDRGGGNYEDKMGHLPNLSWQGQPSEVELIDGTRVLLNYSHWLKTTQPATSLTQQLQETSEFTLSAIVATSKTNQTGPARIVSLSADPYQRNFTLAQEKSDLVLRLRTPSTGENGSSPQLIVPDVFTNTDTHHLIIVYDGNKIKIYIDKAEDIYLLDFYPGVALFQLFLPLGYWSIVLNQYSFLQVYNFIYYAIVFIPLGVMLYLMTTFLNQDKSKLIIILLLSTFLPALILELILTTVIQENYQLENVLLSMAIMSLTMIIVKIWDKSLLPKIQM